MSFHMVNCFLKIGKLLGLLVNDNKKDKNCEYLRCTVKRFASLEKLVKIGLNKQ